eukprot:3259628-Ditylum_brightwellii.AAC.1
MATVFVGTAARSVEKWVAPKLISSETCSTAIATNVYGPSPRRKYCAHRGHRDSMSNLKQVCFSHEIKCQAKKQILSTEAIKDFNVFVDSKIDSIIDKHKKDMCTLGKFSDISISDSN